MSTSKNERPNWLPKEAVATNRGWVHSRTGEVLISRAGLIVDEPVADDKEAKAAADDKEAKAAAAKAEKEAKAAAAKVEKEAKAAAAKAVKTPTPVTKPEAAEIVKPAATSTLSVMVDAVSAPEPEQK